MITAQVRNHEFGKLIHWGQDKMAAILQTTFSNAFCWTNEIVRIFLTISLSFLPEVLYNNIPALIKIMARHRPGEKPLSEPMLVSLLTHIWDTRPQWINCRHHNQSQIYHKRTKLEVICGTLVQHYPLDRFFLPKSPISAMDPSLVYFINYNEENLGNSSCFQS